MKVAAFRAILEAAATLYRDGGNEARALSLIARLLSGRDAMTVPAFAALIARIPATATTNDLGGASDSRQSALDGTATVAGMQATLRDLLTFCHAVGAKTAEKDIKAFADALGEHATKTVEDFCAQADAWLSQEAVKPKGRGKTGAGKSPASNEDAINAHVGELRRAGTDRAAFEAALAALKADKSVKSPAVAEIARRYANTVTKYKSMAAAHADIASAFTQQARFANKVG